MELEGLKIGFVITGAFPIINKTIPKIKDLINEEAIVIPIMSNIAYRLDTKYGKAQERREEIERITGRKIIHNIKYTEPLAKDITDIMIVAPCTRKYNIKTCSRNSRYCSYNSG